jgi:hypothetical protein
LPPCASHTVDHKTSTVHSHARAWDPCARGGSTKTSGGNRGGCPTTSQPHPPRVYWTHRTPPATAHTPAQYTRHTHRHALVIVGDEGHRLLDLHHGVAGGGHVDDVTMGLQNRPHVLTGGRQGDLGKAEGEEGTGEGRVERWESDGGVRTCVFTRPPNYPVPQPRAPTQLHIIGAPRVHVRTCAPHTHTPTHDMHPGTHGLAPLHPPVVGIQLCHQGCARLQHRAIGPRHVDCVRNQVLLQAQVEWWCARCGVCAGGGRGAHERRCESRGPLEGVKQGQEATNQLKAMY